jgi:hypothetical protein
MSTINDVVEYIILLRQEIAKRDQIIQELRSKDKNKSNK